jgi:hypothetical protein
MPGVFAGACRLPPWVDGVWNFVSSSRPWAVRGLQDRDLCPDAVEPHDAVHPAALDRPLALQLESEFDEELGCGREVVNHDADVLHPLDRHLLDGKESRFEPRRQAPEKTDPVFISTTARPTSTSREPISFRAPGGAGRGL